jgi:hypothetical protein
VLLVGQWLLAAATSGRVIDLVLAGDQRVVQTRLAVLRDDGVDPRIAQGYVLCGVWLVPVVPSTLSSRSWRPWSAG